MIEDGSNAQLRLRMQFKTLPNCKVDIQKEVSVYLTAFEPLIQTDKSWYTPGKLVRLRILSLDHKLNPVLKPVV